MNSIKDVKEYTNVIRSLIGKDELRNVSVDLLFKDFEKRMALAKDVIIYACELSLI